MSRLLEFLKISLSTPGTILQPQPLHARGWSGTGLGRVSRVLEHLWKVFQYPEADVTKLMTRRFSRCGLNRAARCAHWL